MWVLSDFGRKGRMLGGMLRALVVVEEGDLVRWEVLLVDVGRSMYPLSKLTAVPRL